MQSRQHASSCSIGAGLADSTEVGRVANRGLGILEVWRLPGAHHQGSSGLLPGEGHPQWLDNGPPHFQDNTKPYSSMESRKPAFPWYMLSLMHTAQGCPCVLVQVCVICGSGSMPRVCQFMQAAVMTDQQMCLICMA